MVISWLFHIFHSGYFIVSYGYLSKLFLTIYDRSTAGRLPGMYCLKIKLCSLENIQWYKYRKSFLNNSKIQNVFSFR